MVSINKNGPTASALNEVVVGPLRIAARAERPPAIPQLIRLTRETEIPHSRAASGFPAAARICFPTVVNSKKTVRSTSRSGTPIIVSTDMPLNTTPPTCEAAS